MIRSKNIPSSRYYAKVLIVFLFFSTLPGAFGQAGLDYYLPDISYDTNIPEPKDILNFQVGEWHITHGQLYYYMKTLCASSKNCIFKEYAKSHENKPLFHLIISSEENIQNIDTLKSSHKKLTDPDVSQNIDINDLPLVLYQGYSIHGNESSGANASTLVAYYLLAGQSTKVKKLLDQTIILIDPCYNPDGFQRFSTWANSNRHSRLNTDPKDREYNEVWPGGRTNHYWFDLNRDWLFNIHPSSKGRIKAFHEWKPDILTDHHEMGSNSTFFFQPGIPSRTNPNTPKLNQELTEDIGRYHAAFLDSIGSMYFTKERYDDYYYGKGSTYPDINGCIGILFEQASSRGHLRETRNGLLSFPFTIRNQLVTSISTQEAALELKNEILEYKRDFFRKVQSSDISKGFYVYEESDSYVSAFFNDMLQRHDIRVYRPHQELRIGDDVFDKEKSFVIPKNQYQAALIKTIFERVKSFPDSVFYDVSAWTLPLALNIRSAESSKPVDMEALLALDGTHKNADKIQPLSSKCRAIAIEWDAYMVPAFLDKILEKEIEVRVLTRKSTVETNKGKRDFKPGTLIIHLTKDKDDRQDTQNTLNSLLIQYDLSSWQITSGLARSGNSIGSNELKVLSKPEIAIIVGEGVNAYEAGDSWYLLDKRWDMQVSIIDQAELAGSGLSRYNLIILPDGSYKNTESWDEKLGDWIKAGGRLIAFRRAIPFVERKGWIKSLETAELNDPEQTTEESYMGYAAAGAHNVIGGSILEAEVDLTHPLLWGYSKNRLPVFKKGTQFYQVDKQAAVPLSYSADPLLSGYLSPRNKLLAPGSASVLCAAYGNGAVIASVDNPNFRAYWLAGSKLFANMIFMSELIDKKTMLENKE